MSTIERLRKLLAEATPGPWRGWTGGIFGARDVDDGHVSMFGDDGAGNRALTVAAVNHLGALLDVAEAAAGHRLPNPGRCTCIGPIDQGTANGHTHRGDCPVGMWAVHSRRHTTDLDRALAALDKVKP